MFTSKARWCRSLGLGALAGTALVSLASAGWQWEPREQVTRAGSSSMPGLVGAGVDEGVPGRTSGVLWHQMVRVWNGSANNGYGYYVRIGPDWQPLDAWENDREAVTDSALGHESTDLSIAVDSSDGVFLAAEIFHLAGIVADTTQPRIGYRRRTASGWTPLHVISPDSTNRARTARTCSCRKARRGTRCT